MSEPRWLRREGGDFTHPEGMAEASASGLILYRWRAGFYKSTPLGTWPIAQEHGWRFGLGRAQRRALLACYRLSAPHRRTRTEDPA